MTRLIGLHLPDESEEPDSEVNQLTVGKVQQPEDHQRRRHRSPSIPHHMAQSPTPNPVDTPQLSR